MVTEENDVELVIVGGGVAGLTAGLYAARERIDTLLLERSGPGGQTNNVARIENFPGFPGGVAGFDLGPALTTQAMDAGLRIEFGEVSGLKRAGDAWMLATTLGPVRAGAVILAGGSELVHLGVPREDEFHGRGVSYCASCDAPLFDGQDVVVVGGGDSALDEALHLTEFAASVTVVHRGPEFSGARATAEQLLSHERVRVVWNHEVRELIGDDGLESVVVADRTSGETRQIHATGIFIFIGLSPNSGVFSSVVDVDAGGHISVDLEMATAQPGLFAAGDIRTRSARQFVSAAGDGATAALSAVRYLRSER